MVVLRIALLIAIAWLIGHWLVRRSRKQHGRSENSIAMVRCHQCGLVIPEQEAVVRDGQTYCEEHAPST